MPSTNVERVEAGFAAHNRGDIDALVEFYDPDAVFETLFLGTHHGNGGIAVDEPFALVFTFRGERVVRQQAFRNREEALAAAGMPAR